MGGSGKAKKVLHWGCMPMEATRRRPKCNFPFAHLLPDWLMAGDEDTAMVGPTAPLRAPLTQPVTHSSTHPFTHPLSWPRVKLRSCDGMCWASCQMVCDGWWNSGGSGWLIIAEGWSTLWQKVALNTSSMYYSSTLCRIYKNEYLSKGLKWLFVLKTRQIGNSFEAWFNLL